MIFKKQNIITQVALEFFMLNVCVLIVLYSTSQGFLSSSSNVLNYWQPLLIFNLGWALMLLSKGDSEFRLSHDYWKRIRNITKNAFLFVGVSYLLVILFQVDFLLSQTSIFLLPIILFSLLDLSLYRLYTKFVARKSQSPSVSQVLIIGASNRWQEIQQFTQKFQQYGYGIVGYLSNKEINNDFKEVDSLGKIKDLSFVLSNNEVDEIFINLSALSSQEIKQAVEIADYHGVRVSLIPETPAYLNSKIKSYTLDDLPVFKLRQTPLDNFNNFLLKKAFDFVFAASVLLVLSPVLLTIALLIYLDGKGPIFYTPHRKGEGDKTFKCYKFRTMSVCDDPINGTKSTVKNDPRITRIGKYLRKYDLDELPQFINVLKGDMSVVGPRPHRSNLHNDFRKIVNDYMVRHYVKPGLSGWAQVNGWRGPAVTNEQKLGRVKHDLWYIENWSFWLDIKIIFMTVFSRKARQNAF